MLGPRDLFEKESLDLVDGLGRQNQPEKGTESYESCCGLEYSEKLFRDTFV